MSHQIAATTLPALLADRAQRHPERIALRVLGDGETVTAELGYGALWARASALASVLAARAPRGARAVILHGNDEHYIAAFLGCLLAGIIAVPAFPPAASRRQALDRLRGIVRDARPALVLTAASLVPVVSAALDELTGAGPRPEIVASDAIAGDAGWTPDDPARPDDVAFLQYTSGSTSAPRGVMVSHANILANERAIHRTFGWRDDEVVVSWLPLYHDMGLIGGALAPLSHGAMLVLMAPEHLAASPARWLRAIARHGGTISGGPDFAFRMCNERVRPYQVEGVRLDSWRVAFCGAEPIRAATLTAFAERFADLGFRASALLPCYGLAEATLLVTGAGHGAGAMIGRFDGDALAAGRVVAADAGRPMVGCGPAAPEHAVDVVDPETGAPVAPGEIGEIVVRGPSVTQGYWNHLPATAETFVRRSGDRALRTGDLGFVHGGELYIAGRRKDVVIVRGHNVYPQDVEQTVAEEIEVLRNGRIAAFAVDGEGAGEGLGIAAELGRATRKLIAPDALCRAIRDAVAEVHGDPPALILLLDPGTLPMTSSGKLRRRECLRAFRAGALVPFAAFERDALIAGPAGAAVAAPAVAASPTAQRLLALVREALGGSEPRLDASLVALGGSSLAAMQLAALVGDELGVAIDAGEVVRARTLGALAAEIEVRIEARNAAGTAGPAAPRAAIPVIPRDGRLPLSPGEQRLWFLHQLEPGSDAYHLAGALRITGPLDAGALAAAFTRLVARHEVLRTQFRSDDRGPFRAIGAPWQVELPVDDLRGRGEIEVDAEIEVEIERRIAREAARPFDLASGPLLRVQLVRIADDEHVVIAVLHHIAGDAGSIEVLRREVARSYAAIASGGDPAAVLPALPVQVADHAAWQDARRTGADAERQIAYWRERVAGPRTVLQLPRSRPLRPGARRDARHRFALDAGLADRLRGVAHRHGATLFAALLGGLQVLLHRYTGQDDLWIGAPIANRRPETERLIGFFVNTCVLRTRIAPRRSFAEHLARVQDTVAGALAHGELPFQRVVELAGGERDADQQALFQVLYNHLAPAYTAPVAAGDVVFGPVERASYAADFDLVLDTAEDAAGITGVISYREDRIDRAAIERLAAHYAALLDALAADPAAAIDRAALLDEAELRAARDQARGARGGGAEHVTDAIARRAAEAPDAIAVRAGDRALDYAALDARTRRWAHALRQLGVGPDAIVGICAEPSLELVVGIVAALRAGGAFLALDPSYPCDRLSAMLADARPAVVLVEDHLRALVAGATGRVVSFADEPALAEPGQADRAAAGPPSADHLAYCIFTSGSTGAPKAAMLTRGGLANHLQWMLRAFPAGSADRVLQCAPSGFDAAVCELLLPLVAGGTCVLAARDDARDPARLIELLARHAITLAIWVPSLLELIADAPDGLAALGRLRCLGSGGEAMPARLAARLIELPCAVWNLYGPTEATIDATVWRLTGDDLGDDAPIGRAIDGATAHVLDAQLAPTPAGGLGELYLGGAGVARGYLGRPALTAERFVPDPFGPPGARLYRTGDLVRRRPDGVIDYVERADRQIKLHGHRIELGEITARLAAEPEIRQATVEIRDDAGKRALVAYVALAADAAGDGREDELREALPARLSRSLPSSMIPRIYVFLPALPVMPSGKLDRAALPAPDLAAAQRPYVAPRTPVEQTLAAIWQAVLGVPRVGRDDNFFLLGGDSIVAIQVVGRARAAGLVISPRDVFRHQTVESLAQVAAPVDGAEVAAAPAPAAARFPLAGLTDEQLAALPIDLGGVEDILPLTPMQDGMLLHTLLEPGSGIYLMQDRYRFDSAIDPAAFLAAWDAVVARHPALRASFLSLADRTLQIVHREVPRATEHIDLRGLPADAQASRIDELLGDERRGGFDLARAPLLKLRLFQLADASFVYVESHHHILMDDWCRSLLFTDFFAAYEALADGRDPALPPAARPAGYLAWLVAQDRSRALAHWEAALDGFEAPTPLALERPMRPDAGASRVAFEGVELSTDDTRAVADAARRLRLTANTLAQGAWAVVLARHAGAHDVVFGVTVAGRPADVPDVQDMVGLFVNTIPLRVRLPAPGDPTPIAAWLAALQDDNLRNRQFEHVPLVDIQARTKVPRGQDLFRSLFVFENAPLAAELRVRAAELRFRLEDNRTHTNYPITVVVIPGERLKLALSYDARRLDAVDVARMVEQLARVLTAIARAPEAPVWSLPLVSPDELAVMTREWNATWRDHGLDGGLGSGLGNGFAERFAARAADAPGRVAARHRGVAITRGALAARAHRVARALHRRGVRPGDPVAVLAERGLDHLGFVTGILAAGAAYVALDVRHPDDRIRHSLRTSGARAVLVTTPPGAPTQRAGDVPVVTLADCAGEPDAPLGLPSHPDQLAYVLYTSGSTGAPKGAMVTLAGMLNNLLGKVPALDLSEQDVIAQTAAPSFDISVWQMLTGLLCGAVVDIVPDDIAGDPRALLDHVRAAGITVLEAVPALIHELVRQPPGALPLRVLLPTGEALTPELARLWLVRHPDIPLVNAYGPAECADDVALCRIATPPPADALCMPIGRPTDNTQLFVLDTSLRPVPVGVVGQLAVAGVGVGRGYAADPARTAAVFVPHPLGRPGERMYLTGDLARHRPDGTLEYVGRADHQVKLRGHRIELGEIEARLVEQAGVAGAAVALRSDGGEPRLVGYVVLDGAAIDPATLRARLAEVLPEIMVPSHIVALDALPRTANGKLDRSALPAPVIAAAQRVAPRTPLEAQLARIWADVLGVPEVGVDDGFFDLGGHSLLITRVSARIRDELGVDLPLRQLFDGQTVAAVAAVIEAGRPSATAAELAVMADLLDELEQT